jgi:cytochrome P450
MSDLGYTGLALILGGRIDMVTAEFNPFTPGTLANPYPMYRALLEQNPVSWNEMMEMWVVARYADVDDVLTRPNMSADRTRARNRFAEMAKQQQENFGPFNRAQTMLSSDPPELLSCGSW